MSKPKKPTAHRGDSDDPKPPGDNDPVQVAEIHRVMEQFNSDVMSGRLVACRACGKFERDLYEHVCPGIHPCIDCDGPADIFVPDPDLYSVTDFGAESGLSLHLTGGVPICDGCLDNRQKGRQRGARLS